MTKTINYTLPDGTQGLAREEISGKAETRDERVKVVPQQVAVYPNPAGEVVNFSNMTSGTQLMIVDITGKTVLKTDINGTSYRWNTTNMNSGLYFYSIYSDKDRIAAGKIAVNK